MRLVLTLAFVTLFAAVCYGQMDPAVVLQQAQNADLAKIQSAQQAFNARNFAAQQTFNSQQATANRIIQNSVTLPTLQRQQAAAVAQQIRINANYQLRAAQQQNAIQFQADRLGFYPRGANGN